MDLWHPETIPADSPFICDVCGKVLSSSSTLKSHINVTHNKKKINYFRFCRVCQVPIEELTNKIDKTDPLADEEGINDIDSSGKSASLRAILLRHFIKCHPDEVVPCSYTTKDGCQEKFVQRSFMLRHVEDVHENRKRYFDLKNTNGPRLTVFPEGVHFVKP